MNVHDAKQEIIGIDRGRDRDGSCVFTWHVVPAVGQSLLVPRASAARI